MKYQLAIFDLDGTLVNSVEDLANAVNYGLQQMGYPLHPLNDFYQFVGNGVPKLCQRALPQTASQDEVDHLISIFNGYYQEHCVENTKAYPGMMEALNQMRAAGMQLTVASNKTAEFSQKIVHQIFGTQIFTQILGGNVTRPKKPAPDILLEMMEICHVTNAQTVMIGDSNVDIQTANNANIESIGCTWGFRGEEELQRAGATCLIHAPDALPAACGIL